MNAEQALENLRNAETYLNNDMDWHHAQGKRLGIAAVLLHASVMCLGAYIASVWQNPMDSWWVGGSLIGFVTLTIGHRLMLRHVHKRQEAHVCFDVVTYLDMKAREQS